MFGNGKFSNGFDLFDEDPLAQASELDREMKLDALDMADELAIETIEIDIERHALAIREHQLAQATIRTRGLSSAPMSASPFGQRAGTEELSALLLEGFELDIKREQLEIQLHRHQIRLVRRVGKLRRVNKDDIVEIARQKRNITATRLDIDNAELQVAIVTAQRSEHEQLVIDALASTNPLGSLLSTLITTVVADKGTGKSAFLGGFGLPVDTFGFDFSSGRG